MSEELEDRPVICLDISENCKGGFDATVRYVENDHDIESYPSTTQNGTFNVLACTGTNAPEGLVVFLGTLQQNFILAKKAEETAEVVQNKFREMGYPPLLPSPV